MTHLVGLHRQPGEEREEYDFYATCPTTIPPLLNLLGWSNGGKVIWENSCGMGHLAEALKIYGHTVIASDLIDRGYGIPGIDFLEPSALEWGRYDAVIMNPPYKLTQKFIVKSLRHAPVVCAFLRLSFLESIERRSFFKTHPPLIVAVFSKRAKSEKNGNFKRVNKKGKKSSGSVAYAWFIFTRDNLNDPIIKWI